jgi:hypothetical protein
MKYMKPKTTFKYLCVITCVLLQVNHLWAQNEPPLTLHVETAGTLPALIPADRKYLITDLTLTGNLNGTDIRFIREMAGRTDFNEATTGSLAVLNLAGANIVSGGDYYFSPPIGFSSGTSDNSISENMFHACGSLTSITIPNSVTTIGEAAFFSCTGLTGITIPNGVTSIERDAFRGCTGLKEFIVSEQNGTYAVIDGVLFNKDKTTLILYPYAKSSSYTIPQQCDNYWIFRFFLLHRINKHYDSQRCYNYWIFGFLQLHRLNKHCYS